MFVQKILSISFIYVSYNDAPVNAVQIAAEKDNNNEFLVKKSGVNASVTENENEEFKSSFCCGSSAKTTSVNDDVENIELDEDANSNENEENNPEDADGLGLDEESTPDENCCGDEDDEDNCCNKSCKADSREGLWVCCTTTFRTLAMSCVQQWVINYALKLAKKQRDMYNDPNARDKFMRDNSRNYNPSNTNGQNAGTVGNNGSVDNLSDSCCYGICDDPCDDPCPSWKYACTEAGDEPYYPQVAANSEEMSQYCPGGMSIFLIGPTQATLDEAKRNGKEFTIGQFWCRVLSLDIVDAVINGLWMGGLTSLKTKLFYFCGKDGVDCFQTIVQYACCLPWNLLKGPYLLCGQCCCGLTTGMGCTSLEKDVGGPDDGRGGRSTY